MSIFPFIDSTSTSTETNDELPMLKEYAYDFEKNELLLDEGGRTYMVEGNEALRIWIFKALFTERCHYTAYSFAFGSEIQDQVIGHSMNVEIVKLVRSSSSYMGMDFPDRKVQFAVRVLRVLLFLKILLPG